MSDLYGAKETNALQSSPTDWQDYLSTVNQKFYWDEPGLRVTRLRLISDPGIPWWDVSYCFGRIDDQNIEVELPFDQLPKRGLSRAIVEYAKKDGVYAKGIGILTNISTLC